MAADERLLDSAANIWVILSNDILAHFGAYKVWPRLEQMVFSKHLKDFSREGVCWSAIRQPYQGLTGVHKERLWRWISKLLQNDPVDCWEKCVESTRLAWMVGIDWQL